MKKVVFLVAHLLRGGAENTVKYLSDFLCENGDEVYIISTSDEQEIEVSKNVKLIKMDIISRKGFIARIGIAIKRRRQVRILIRSISPNVVVCMKYAMARYLLFWEKRKSFRLVVSERSNPAYLSSGWKKVERSLIMNNCDGIIFQTERAQKFFPRHIQNKSVVIQNAIGSNDIMSAVATYKFENVIVAVGNLRPQKDYVTLLKAFSIVVDKYPCYKLVIYGDGQDRNMLEKLASELLISDSVFFEGNVKNGILNALNARCYVMSSVSEGMPNSLLEAMSIGIPCVSTDCPNGPSELITDGVDGLLVEVGNEVQLANAICRYIEDDDFAEKCGTNAAKKKMTNCVSKIGVEYDTFFSKY